MSRLSEIFKAKGKCFIPFVTSGHPSMEASREIVLELAGGGADIIEIGIPFSDPIADGPSIQKSSFSALEKGYRMEDHLELVQRVRGTSDVGLIFMTYLNPVLQYGVQRLDEEASSAGLDGILISDLTPEEVPLVGTFEHLDTIFLAAPTSSESRLQRISNACRGFLYLVARTGITGAQTDVKATVPSTIARIRRYTNLPVAVGFGIKTAADVEAVWKVAEGAVVGTALVEFIEDHRDDPELVKKVSRFVRETLLP